MNAEILATLDQWSDAGWLRRLDSALAAFVAELDPLAPPALLVAGAMLAQMEGRGHSCLPLASVVADPQSVLGWPAPAQDALAAFWTQLPAALADWLAALRASPVVRVAGRDADEGQPLVLGGTPQAPLLYLRRYWDYERQVAAQVRARTQAAVDVAEAEVRAWLDRLFEPAPGAPPGAVDWQKLACAVALRGRLSVITGGPGTGKTYTAARLLALLFAVDPRPDQLRVALAAPTGKAAARLKQSIDVSLASLQPRLAGHLDLGELTQRMGAARTLHALLGARPDTRMFKFHAGNPLDVDVLIVDEASMVHLEMMAALLDALPPTARLILLGDKDQLASVEAGAVLGDLCRDAAAGRYSAESARYAREVAGQDLPDPYLEMGGTGPVLAQQTVMLRESRRFGGPIGKLALAVNRGDAAAVQKLLAGDASGALHAREGSTPAAVVQLAAQGRPGSEACYRPYLERLAQRPPEGDADAHAAWVRSVLAAFDRFRLLCAVREGDWGTAGLNRAVQKALGDTGGLQPRGEWYPGRPVMVTRNDPTLGVFNGDIGIALPPATPGGGLRAYFADGEVLRSVGVSRLAHVETAFAMTVHKSQGSEFEHTVLVLPPQAGSALNRELVYTGITRARSAFTLMAAQPGVLARAVLEPTRRASGLLGFLTMG